MNEKSKIFEFAIFNYFGKLCVGKDTTAQFSRTGSDTLLILVQGLKFQAMLFFFAAFSALKLCESNINLNQETVYPNFRVRMNNDEAAQKFDNLIRWVKFICRSLQQE